MDLGIRGRVAVVCGASAGMGKATARSLALEGARVAVCARNEATLEAAAREIRSAAAGGEVLAFAADVTREASLDALVREVSERLGLTLREQRAILNRARARLRERLARHLTPGADR